MGEVVPREGTCPSGRGDGSGFSPCGGRGAVKGMEPRFGFGWGGVGDLRRVSSCSRLERTRDVRVEMGAESAQVVVLGLGPGRPFPAPSLFADGPPPPAAKLVRCAGRHPCPARALSPGLSPPPVPPLCPRLLLALPFSPRGAGLAPTGRCPRLEQGPLPALLLGIQPWIAGPAELVAGAALWSARAAGAGTSRTWRRGGGKDRSPPPQTRRPRLGRAGATRGWLLPVEPILALHPPAPRAAPSFPWSPPAAGVGEEMLSDGCVAGWENHLAQGAGWQRVLREGWGLHSGWGHRWGVGAFQSAGAGSGLAEALGFGLRKGQVLRPRPCQAPAGLLLSPSTSWVGWAWCVELRRQLSQWPGS